MLFRSCLANGSNGMRSRGGDILEKGTGKAIGSSIGTGTIHSFSLRSHGLLFGWGIKISTAGNTSILAHVVGQQGSKQLLNSILAADFDAAVKFDPCALVFSVSSLNLFVFPGLDLLFQYLGALALVYASDFEDLGGIEARVVASPHDSDVVDFHFVDVDTGVGGLAG